MLPAKIVRIFSGAFAPLQLIAGMGLIFTRLKWLGVITVLTTLMIIPISMAIVKITVNIRRLVNTQKDERINRTAELIAGIKYIKMYGWEMFFK